jgi:glutamate--cysteine ligase catalytic subunit
MRFKPPTPNSKIGWRVEFRSMDIQLTDHENAVYSIFIVLLAKTIAYFDLNLYIPISKVDENMARCQKRDAVLQENFWFRHDISAGLGFVLTRCRHGFFRNQHQG